MVSRPLQDTSLPRSAQMNLRWTKGARRVCPSRSLALFSALLSYLMMERAGFWANWIIVVIPMERHTSANLEVSAQAVVDCIDVVWAGR